MLSTTNSTNNFFDKKQLQIIINLLKHKFQNNLLEQNELDLYIKIEKLINKPLLEKGSNPQN